MTFLTKKSNSFIIMILDALDSFLVARVYAIICWQHKNDNTEKNKDHTNNTKIYFFRLSQISNAKNLLWLRALKKINKSWHELSTFKLLKFSIILFLTPSITVHSSKWHIIRKSGKILTLIKISCLFFVAEFPVTKHKW